MNVVMRYLTVKLDKNAKAWADKRKKETVLKQKKSAKNKINV